MTPIKSGTAKRLGLRAPAYERVGHVDPVALLREAGFSVPTQDQWAGIAKTLRAAAWHLLASPRTP